MIPINKPNGEMYAEVGFDKNWLKLTLASFPKGYFIAMDKKILPMLIDALVELRKSQEK